MQEHPWLQKIHLVAYCPKCKAPSLRRGHAKTRMEQYRKKHSEKRLFVCTSCGWKGWSFENQLDYPIAPTPHYEFNDQIESTIPSGLLQELMAADQAQQGQESNRSSANQTPVMKRTDPPSPPSSGYLPPVDDSIPDFSLHPEEPMPELPESLEDEQRHGPSVFESWGVPPPIDDTPVFASAPSHKERTKHSGRECPKCGEASLHRSHHRGFFERLRKTLTGKRVFRCHTCDWRGWLSKH